MTHTKAQPALAQFIRENGLKKQQFAAKIGVLPSHLSRWLNGKVIPRKPYRAMIEVITLGQVLADEWGADNEPIDYAWRLDAGLMLQQGFGVEDIAAKLSVPVDQVQQLFSALQKSGRL
jgi:DNA-binding transcriptional regulator YdaS (Cro superfamily)